MGDSDVRVNERGNGSRSGQEGERVCYLVNDRVQKLQ